MQTIDFSRLQKTAKSEVLLLSIFLMIGCASAGKDFPVEKVSEIQIEKTTQQEIRDQFGSSWRVGIKDGQNTWTYGKYKYKVIRDLHLITSQLQYHLGIQYDRFFSWRHS
jgi:hypothetical protein